MPCKITRSVKDLLTHRGCYSLIIDLKRKKRLRVGKLGEAVFPAGTYVYTGSAMKGLEARLRRHCARKKKMHWHIDHLLTLPDAQIQRIILYPVAPGQECRQNKRIAARRGRSRYPEKLRRVRLQVRLCKPSVIFCERLSAEILRA